MASSPLSVEVVRFGEYEANLRSRELRRDGVSVRLPDQSFEVLVMLLDRPGELVTREEIHKRLWSADTFVDFDHGLNNAVKRLRDTLGDSAESPRFVETLPRRGYRFIGQLQPLELAESNGKTGEANGAVYQRRKVGKLSLVWMGMIGSLLLAWLAFSAGRRLFHSDPPAVAIRSIAVLPLENLSGDSTRDYFADGMTEQLITELGQVKALRVISHTSVNQYKGTTKPVPVIARELQVDAVVEGTVTRSEGRVRVTANLVQAFPEKHLWANTYERDVRDTLSLQAEVSQEIARAVRVELTPKERESFAVRHPTNLEAQEAYLKGLSHFVRGKDQLFVKNEGKEELYKANDYFQQAIAIDPQYALAYAGLGRSFSWLADVGSPGAIEAARAASDRAIALEENLAEAHMVRGGVLLNGDPDWAGAEREFLRTVELNPSYAEGHQAYGIYLSLRGRFDEATAEADRAVVLDPVGRSAKSQAAWIDVCAGNYDKAITRLQNITELFPDDALSRSGLGTAYVLRGRFEEGIAELRRAAGLWGKDPSRNPDLSWAYAMSGNRYLALQILDEVKRESAHDADTEYQVALIYAGLGDNDQVFIWLDKAYRDRHDVLNEIWREPQLIPLHTDPRLRQLASKLGIIA